MSLLDLKRKGNGLPSRVVMHGVEGIGKTSFAAFAPTPVFLQTKGESGLETLIDSKQLPEIDHFPELQTWGELRAAVAAIAKDEHDFKTLVIDTGNGAEQLCHEEVCRRDYANDWGPKGFTSYMQGYSTALADWREFLADLDALRATRKMGIIVLCHTKVATFKNPGGADYDRYEAKMHAKTWALTKEWADIVLFGDYDTDVSKQQPKDTKGKASDGKTRVLYTERTAVFDAKNRHGLPDEIDMGTSGKEAWTNFVTAMKEARK